MNKFLSTVTNSIRSFTKEEDGAQVVEYALIIAVVSIALVVALRSLTGASFTGFITRVGLCLSGGACAATTGA